MNEVVGAPTSVGRTWWDKDQGWPGIKAANLKRGPGVRSLVADTELTQNGNPDLGLEGDLVSDLDTLQRSWQLNSAMMAKEARKEIPDLLGGVRRVHLDIVQGRALVGTAEGVEHVNDLEVEPDAVRVQHQLDHVGHLPARSIGKILPRDIEAWKASDHEPVLVVSVLEPVIELGVNCNLVADLPLEPSVPVLKIGHPILVVTNLLLDLGQLGIAAGSETLEQKISLVEEMENKMKTCHGCQIAAIW